MLIVLIKVISIFSLILIGYIANKTEVLPASSLTYLTNLLLYITSPCMIMSSIYSNTLSPGLIKSTIEVSIGSVVYFIVSSIFAYLAIRLLKFKPKEDYGMYICAISLVNTGFMGFPITKEIFGNTYLYLMAIQNIFLNIYLVGFTPSVLNIGHKVKTGFKHFLKSMCSVITLSIFGGLALLFTGIKPPAVLNDIIIMLSNATIPVSMIVVGIQLGSSKFKTLINKYNIIATVISMFLIPAATFIIVDSMDFLMVETKVTLVFASAFPTAVMGVVFAKQYNKNSRGMAEIVSLSTLISIGVIPFAAAFLSAYYKL
ncbi:MAG: AEC family transporter [Hornefia sp.]|nr:AEC family transporter [Hornefia sp.]